MRAYDIKAFDEWERHAVSDVMVFQPEMSRRGYRPRRVRFGVNAPGQTHVYAHYEGREPVLVASDSGLFEIEMTISEPVTIHFANAAGEQYLAVRNFAADHIVERASEEILTSIMTGRRNNSEFDRMMLIMRANERDREERLKNEIAKLRAQSAAPATAKGPAPKPDPEPAADPAADDNSGAD